MDKCTDCTVIIWLAWSF